MEKEGFSCAKYLHWSSDVSLKDFFAVCPSVLLTFCLKPHWWDVSVVGSSQPEEPSLKQLDSGQHIKKLHSEVARASSELSYSNRPANRGTAHSFILGHFHQGYRWKQLLFPLIPGPEKVVDPFRYWPAVTLAINLVMLTLALSIQIVIA